ncbi:putative protein kinase RLK-Pelle-RKF3 family [Rosa chinensis]|uniref:non-specific serine/threonine protein kinase n=1 Tax=Rosa chinensis TaxID=74649 RepID=A0A2P6R6M5_ROSCH|nr:probable LRR receptor-like serine/threonine-protein kinase RKF3 [Rosa chinensis]PRQ42059.1 putative protein kinase RLK-Pelle-RKF3 family [Rosa chinensis]
MLFFFFCYLYLGLVPISFPSCGLFLVSGQETPRTELGGFFSSCPLNIEALRELIFEGAPKVLDVQTECQYILEGIRLLRSDYLRSTGYFSPPSYTIISCWDAYQALISESIPDLKIGSTCGFKPALLSETCMNITTRSEFESLIPKSELQVIEGACSQSLDDYSPCFLCRRILSSLNMSHFGRGYDGNVADCNGYPYIYAAALGNRKGPINLSTAKCLFSLNFNSFDRKTKNKHRVLLWAVLIGSVCGFTVAFLVVWVLWGRHRRRNKKMKDQSETSGFVSATEIIGENTSLARFPFEELKKATDNFARENIIGIGGYGNVYKGTLADGSEVALKRFKNLSAAGDVMFAHELEVIASIRHVNLVAVRGYCTIKVPRQGHQRIMVCDLVNNGSLYEHLFDSRMKKKQLSWPIRQKIALGMARGLAYLHYGVQPAVIHRDVKASNVLLDEEFEPKLADFGLAKFTPEGQTHMHTRVAGTFGYVAPEYALYGQLSERSDVYSFGIALLELLSGKRAVIEASGTTTLLLADWAWSQVRKGRPLDVIDESIQNLSSKEVMENYVMVAVLSAHPESHARPTMDQIVKILERDFQVPSNMDAPIHKIDQSASSSGSSYISSNTG